MAENNQKKFLEIEDELNNALGNIGNIGKDIKLQESNENRVDNYTVEKLLEDMKIDEFEKIYVTTAAISNTPNMEEIPDDKIDDVKTMAEYKLSKMKLDEYVDEKSKEKLKSASNFYLIPRVAEQKVSVGNQEQTKTVDLYTVNDVEGYCLYTIIGDNNVTISKNFKEEIEKYVMENYKTKVDSGELKVNEVVEHFTPNNIDDLYNKVSEEYTVTMRFLPDRIDEFARSKGIEEKDVGVKERKRKDIEDNLLEENKIKPQEEIEEPENNNDEINNGLIIDDKEEKNEEKTEIREENYIEKIARMNHVNPNVVNTREIEDFEQVEEDTGIVLKGRYKRGDVVAVRIPYKLQYRTFLVDKNTGMTIDGNGDLDRKSGKFYDFDEVEEYFRYELRGGPDGGDAGTPLRHDERDDKITYIDEKGTIQEEDFVNNGKQKDMMKEERQRYITEVGEIDKRLSDAIEEYQKNATRENYERVRDLIKEKVEIDNKYNALDNQRELTEKTKENIEHVIEKDLDEDDWFPNHDER